MLDYEQLDAILNIFSIILIVSRIQARIRQDTAEHSFCGRDVARMAPERLEHCFEICGSHGVARLLIPPVCAAPIFEAGAINLL